MLPWNGHRIKLSRFSFSLTAQPRCVQMALKAARPATPSPGATRTTMSRLSWFVSLPIGKSCADPPTARSLALNDWPGWPPVVASAYVRDVADRNDRLFEHERFER